MNHQGKR